MGLVVGVVRHWCGSADLSSGVGGVVGLVSACVLVLQHVRIPVVDRSELACPGFSNKHLLPQCGALALGPLRRPKPGMGPFGRSGGSKLRRGS